MDRAIFRETGLTPAQVHQMTLAEIVVVTEADDAGGSIGGVSPDELAYCEWYDGLTDEQKLWAEDY